MDRKDRVQKSYELLDYLRLESGLYLASVSKDYHFVWLRDSFYEVLPYLKSDCDRYEKTYHAILDILKFYKPKFDPLTFVRPKTSLDYIHPRYTEDGKEVPVEWGDAQNDATGAILYGIALGEKNGKKIIRDLDDLEVIQNLVWYLNTVHYWTDADNGMWEENLELHMSSVGACLAGLFEIKDIVNVPKHMIIGGQKSLNLLFPHESPTKTYDLAQLSLIYPYNLLSPQQSLTILEGVEKHLLRDSGVIRYKSDSYYCSDKSDDRKKPDDYYVGKEAEWTMGLPWLSLCYLQLGNIEKAKYYLELTESKMVDNYKLPELYYANTTEANPNTPLGWSNALYIIAVREYELVTETKIKNKKEMSSVK